MHLKTAHTNLFSLFILCILSIQVQAQCPIETACGSLPVAGGFPVGGNTFFCEGETVIFENNTNPSQVDTTIIDWGDGQLDTFTIDLQYQHIYDFAEDTCLMGATSIIPEITMTVINACDDGQSVNCVSTFVQIKVKPYAFFEATFQACSGVNINFDNQSCVNGSDFTYLWDFGGQGTSDEENPNFPFDNAGFQTVTLTVTNECGQDTYTQIVEIIDPPSAGANITDGTVAGQADPYVVCLIDGGIVCLEGASSSNNESNYAWTVLQGSGFVWILPDSIPIPILPELKIQFLEAGLYDIVLETNNPCNQPASDTLSFEVIGSDFLLNPQDDGCVSLEYTPSPLENNVIYTINGVEASNFPTTLGIGEYIVEVTGASNLCPSPVLADTFLVVAEEDALILTPDTTICALDGDFTFEATPENADWFIDGDTFSGILNPEDYTEGSHEITYGKVPCISFDTVYFIIVKADIGMPDDTELCIDGLPFTFVATPPGGTWSGSVVTPSGIFDPTLSGTGVFTLYYEFSNPTLLSCSNIDSVQVTVSQLMVDFVVDTCDNTTLCFDTLNTSSFTSILWDFDGTGTSSQTAPCHTFPAAQSYDVTATIENGTCTASVTNTVSIEAPPIAGFNLDYDNNGCSPLTANIENTSSGNNLIYEWRLDGIIFSNLENPPPLLLEADNEDTSFEISLSLRNDCSTSTQSEMVLVHPLPVSLFGTDENEYCSEDSILMANISHGNIENYQWFLNGELISTDSIEPVITHTTTVVDTIEICLVTNNFCGADTLCSNIIITPTDVNAFFNTSPTTICEGDTVWFTNFATLGVPVYYDFGDNNGTSTPNPFHVYSSAGTYLVTQQAFGCGSDTFEKMIEVQEGPTANWNTPILGCPGDDLLFENTSLGVMDFEWDFGDNSPVSAEESPTHFFDSAGFYNVCLTVFSDDVDGCSNTLCQSIEVFEPPTAGFNFTDSLCLGDISIFTNTASSDVILCDYQFGDGNAISNCNPSHEYLTTGAFIVTQIVENQNFCKDTLSQQIFVRKLPLPVFEFESISGCHPDSVSFTNLSQNADSYLWNFGDNSTSTLTNPIHYYQNAGSYTVSLIATIDGICSGEAVQELIVNETPLASFIPDASSLCAGLEVNFSNTSTGTFTETFWDFGDGFFSFEDSPTHIFETPDDYTIQLIVKNQDLCADTTTFEITIHEALAVDVAFENILCNNETTGSIDLTISSGTFPFNFNWSNGAESEDINNLPAGNYSIILTDDNACQWTNMVEITQPDILEMEVEESIVSCFGASDGSLEIAISGGIEPYQILWETGETSNLANNLSAENYSLTITDANNCIIETTIPLAENPPIEYLDTIEHISCFGANDGVISFDDIWGGVAPYAVNIISDNYAEGGVNVTRFDNLAPNVYSIQIEDANGCLEILESEILEPDPLFVNIKEDTIIMNLGGSEEIITFYNANNPTFLWTPSIRLSCLDCPEPIADPQTNQAYILTMTDENNCIDIDSIFILIRNSRNVFIPNTFTPNGDLRNDIFRIRSKAIESIKRVKTFQIFDRWGELMFEVHDFLPNDRQFGWDGYFRGKRVEPGVYTYFAVIEYVDEFEEIRKGEVLLIR